PDVLHIVITSRSMPNLSVTRLRSKGLVGVLDRQDLLFTQEEVERLFTETFGRSLRPEMVSQLYKETDGWVTALQLIQQSFDRTSDHQHGTSEREASFFASAFHQSELDIFDYFAEEVLQFETPETRLMLARLSLLERVDPAICDAALGISDCREHLHALARRNVFISHTYASGVEEEYRLHPLFRSFLNRWLANEVGAAEVKRLHRECAAYFARTGQWDLAVNHFTEAEAAGDVAAMLAKYGADLVGSGRFETIKRAFERLPEASLFDNPHALITRADVGLIEGDHARALSLYVQAAQMARAKNEKLAEAESLRGQAYIARYRGDCEHAVRLATAAIELAPELPRLRARCFNIIGLCQFILFHDTRKAIESWRAALEEARRADDDRFSRIVLHNLGLPYSREGDFNEALRWLSQMIEGRPENDRLYSAKAKAVPFPQEAIAHLNVARLQVVQGRLDEAEFHLHLALDRCQLFNLKTATAETLEAFGNLYRERGDFNRALDFYNEAARAYRDAGLALTDRELLDERATLYLRMGETALAEREADEYYRARAQGSPAERAAALITRGRIDMALGRTDAAEAELTEAIQLTRSDNLYFNEARAVLPLAKLLWDTGRRDEALVQLRRVIDLAIRYDYSFWLASEAAHSPALFGAAIKAGMAADYLVQVVPLEVGRAEARAPEDGPKPPPASPVESIIERPTCDLALNLLGPVEILRAPSEPLKEAWRLSKALHILCYVASRRNHRAPKETLVDIFWAEADAETVSKNFHPTISHLRKALNSGQVVKKDFILYREGAYLLNPQYTYQVDTEEFERLIADARESRRAGDADGSAEKLAEAIRLYRGDFLEEFYYNWIDELQSYYRDLYLEALKELISYHGERNNHDQVIRYGQMILQRDHYQEEVHCRVMEAYVLSGNRAAAIEQFDGLRKLLRRELGVEPLPATIARYEALIR
ncbi:MAG TPA: BTAD domain-containing putative transcriptional regulator, partial [Blastocatellia bacterium]|nr:BTAD domain-containing putative transcriptional regulator [Blastocatellia bacterium]